MMPLPALFLLALLIAAAAGPARATPPSPIDFPLAADVRGSRALFAGERAVVLIGEIHGTMEIPLLTAVLLRTASADRAAVLCLEIPGDEQKRLGAFLVSDGGEPAVQALLAGQHWASQDGRAGQGHFALLELARRLIAQGRDITVVAIDLPSNRISKLLREQPTPDRVLAFARQRDRFMAARVGEAVERSPEAHVLVLAGNVHTSLRPGAPWDDRYQPMGALLRGKLPRVTSLSAETSGGTAWVITDQGAGPTSIAGEDRGEEPFVELKTGNSPIGSGRFYVGPVTVASPMRKEVAAADSPRP